MLSTVRMSSKFNKGMALSGSLPNVLAKSIKILSNDAKFSQDRVHGINSILGKFSIIRQTLDNYRYKLLDRLSQFVVKIFLRNI